jgi:CRP-like cAMP-binding protein
MDYLAHYQAGGLKNQILDGLSEADLSEVLQQAEPFTMARGKVLAPAFAPIDHIYFPTRGMASLRLGLKDGVSVEIGVVGSEGLMGWQFLANRDQGPIEAVVQIDMTGYRIKADQLLALADKIAPLRKAIMRSVQSLFDLVAQTAACGQRHTSTERLAKWLLMADDRSDGAPLTISHETLSILLGIRRAGVTVAMGELRRYGCVENGHGSTKIIDRQRLEGCACECYGLLRNETKRRAR